MVRFIILLLVSITCFNNEDILASARTSSSATLPDVQLSKKLKTYEIDGAFINAAAVLTRLKVDAAGSAASSVCPASFGLPIFSTFSAAANTLPSTASKKELSAQLLDKQKATGAQASNSSSTVNLKMQANGGAAGNSDVADENNDPILHEEKQRYSCELCPKSYTRRSTLNDHMKTHKNAHCKTAGYVQDQKMVQFISGIRQNFLLHHLIIKMHTLQP